ncbi:hypothetical protein MSAN_00520600 [Mycena sanguinolenta]|uniref:Uncharacterized protein n=1 Tax=Mycena sanguinolenta TaxID=230812 RepID=A0A8H6Z5U9_9AGAR|nr:hypothetical protein MSAN_00520600 [Mycena sanguinolenta]
MADLYDEKDSASSSPVDVLPSLGYDKADSSSSLSADSIKEPSRRRALMSPPSTATPSPRAPAHTRPTSVVLLPLPTFVHDAADIV